MKYIFTLLFLTFNLIAMPQSASVISIDKENKEVKINIEKIDVGVSGYIVKELAKGHSSILKNVIVTDFKNGIATLKMSEFEDLKNNALPNGLWEVEVGDKVVLAFAYSRALLIAPSDDIYHKITKSAKGVHWLHPDLFVALLNMHGHPTPTREDFHDIALGLSVGLIFIYIEQKIYMVDAKSFKILAITSAPLEQKDVKLPFYHRLGDIEEAWFGEGSDPLESYEPYYYELLEKFNQENVELLEMINKQKEKDVG